MKIVLVGNPNVGKSVLFSRLTGVKVIASNYPGTTVEFTKGFILLDGIQHELIDIPGTYSLNPTSKAESVALELLEQADIIINVVDATNLERNLRLTLELIHKTNKPMVVALNLWDETKHRGVEIDLEKLKAIFGIPVIATCGLIGQGMKELVLSLRDAKVSPFKHDQDSLWDEIGKIVKDVQILHHRHHTFLDVVQEASIKPPFSFGIAALIIAAAFMVVRFVGEGLIGYVFDPFFTHIYTPLMVKLSGILGEGTFLQEILVGKITEGTITYSESFGVFTTGLYVPFAMVLPYVCSFYFILGILEDWGYLPRLAVIMDRSFHRIGLHGYAVIPTILGLGCNVPGALSLRLFEERREKFIAATLMAIAVPCMAQSAVIIGLLGPFGGQYVLLVFFNLFIIWFVIGKILHVTLPGRSPEILLEIPPYRRPHVTVVVKKLWTRISWFVKEALPMVLMGIFLVNVLLYLKVIDMLSVVVSPVLTKLWGLPKESMVAFLIGFLRKDVAVGMLRPLGLTVKQLVVGTTILAIYFPCAATLFILVKELGIKDMCKSIIIMCGTAISVGWILNTVLSLMGM
ncbi:MAG: ferrous iron transporter B [Candidatus Omnitrophica bacterium]|nr:ferrous iron transporter B [Candidatus Omnitrophota bacterium]